MPKRKVIKRIPSGLVADDRNIIPLMAPVVRDRIEIVEEDDE
jgi:hypothetical protein